VATVATYETQEQGQANVVTSFRNEFRHSVALATLMGLLVLLQAYACPWMQVPSRPERLLRRGAGPKKRPGARGGRRWRRRPTVLVPPAPVGGVSSVP
ncbi:hypothetical protein ABG088_00280, partial [Hydrogenibacillus schlegelii]